VIRSLAVLALLSGIPAAAQSAVDLPLQRALDSLVSARGLDAGIAVVEARGGSRAAVNGNRRYTMMSVYKLPIGVSLLRRVARGELSLDDSVVLRPSDRRLGPARDPLSRRITAAGLRLPLREVLRAMLEESDNTASDYLLRRLTPAVVTRETAALVGGGIRLDRQEGELALAYHGARLPRGESPTPEAVERAIDRVPQDERARAALAFPHDVRDTATPLAMGELLVALSRGRALGTAETALLRGMMERTVTGPNRLRAGLPAGTALAHRTGSGPGPAGRRTAINNVGLIGIPGRGDVAVAVFVRSAPEAAAEDFIADVARLVYAHYTRTGRAMDQRARPIQSQAR
jgi:beta-lactamase class A